MWILLLVVIIAAIYIYYTYTSNSLPEQPATSRGISKEIEIAQRRLTEIMDTCTKDHPEAVHALTWMSGSDGTVSRQELRIIIGFCERQGAPIRTGWQSVIDYLNSGLSLSTTGGETGAKENIAALSSKPITYRAAFLGAAEAILAANKTTNAAKRRLVESARKLIEE